MPAKYVLSIVATAGARGSSGTALRSTSPTAVGPGVGVSATPVGSPGSEPLSALLEAAAAGPPSAAGAPTGGAGGPGAGPPTGGGADLGLPCQLMIPPPRVQPSKASTAARIASRRRPPPVPAAG